MLSSCSPSLDAGLSACLVMASARGEVRVVQLLLEDALLCKFALSVALVAEADVANVDAECGAKALASAAKECLMAKKVQVGSRAHEALRVLLWLPRVQQHAAAFAEDDNQSALSLAVTLDNVEVVSLLLEYAAFQRSAGMPRSVDGATALKLAAKLPSPFSPAITRALLQCDQVCATAGDFTWNSRGRTSRTPLMEAALNATADHTSVLLACPQVEATAGEACPHTFQTALMLAAERKNEVAVRALIQSPKVRETIWFADARGTRALIHIVRMKNPQLLQDVLAFSEVRHEVGLSASYLAEATDPFSPGLLRAAARQARNEEAEGPLVSSYTKDRKRAGGKTRFGFDWATIFF